MSRDISRLHWINEYCISATRRLAHELYLEFNDASTESSSSTSCRTSPVVDYQFICARAGILIAPDKRVEYRLFYVRFNNSHYRHGIMRAERNWSIRG